MAERARKQAELDKYNADLAKAMRGKGMPTGGVSPQNASLIKVLQDAGALPKPPAAHVVTTTSLADVTKATTALNEVLRATPRSNRLKRTQVTAMIRAIRQEVGRQAELMGPGWEGAERKMVAANAYWHKNVAPFHDAFGGVGSKDFAEHTTTMDVYNRVKALVEGGDPEKIDAFAKLLGPQGKRMMGDVLLNQMLVGAQRGEQWSAREVEKYFQKNERTFLRLLGHDRFTELKGQVKVATQINQELEEFGKIKQPKDVELTRHGRMFSPWLTIIGVEHLVRGVAAGHFLHGIAQAGIYAGSGVAGHALAAIMHDMTKRLPGSKAAILRASQMKPGSPELQRLVDQIGWRYQRLPRIGIAAVGQAQQGELRNPLGMGGTGGPAEISYPPPVQQQQPGAGAAALQ